MNHDGQRLTFRVPEDLAEIFIEASVATPDFGHRSASLPQLIEQGALVAGTIITLVQGPIVIGQLTQYVRTWFQHRRDRHAHIGTLEFHPQFGDPIIIPVDDYTDVERVAEAISLLYFTPPLQPKDTDDWRRA